MNDFAEPEDFYAIYDRHRTYVRAEVKKKHLAEFGRNLWVPGEFAPQHRILELGCGCGVFLAFIAAKGGKDFLGVEMDPKARQFMPASIAERVSTTTIDAFLKSYDGPPFDRVVMLDVFEHFSHPEGVALLRRVAAILAPNGRIVLRVPNASSPWGLQYQFGDLTHKALYAPDSIRQVGVAAGLDCLGCHSYKRGSVARRFATRIIEGTLNALLTDPPPMWSANLVAVLSKAAAP